VIPNHEIPTAQAKTGHKVWTNIALPPKNSTAVRNLPLKQVREFAYLFKEGMPWIRNLNASAELFKLKTY